MVSIAVFAWDRDMSFVLGIGLNQNIRCFVFMCLLLEFVICIGVSMVC